MLSKYIEPFPFFMAIFFGLMMCYVMTPAPQVVFRHPTPENVKDTIGNQEGVLLIIRLLLLE